MLSLEIVEDSSARLLALYDETVEAVIHPGHPLAARGETGSCQTGAGRRWAIYPTNRPRRLVLEREFAAVGLEFLHYPVETASTFAMFGLLQEDPALAALLMLTEVASVRRSLRPVGTTPPRAGRSQ